MAAERTELLVGLDVGTTGVKAIAVEPDGRVAGSAEHGYPLSTPRAGWSEQDPEDWWRATRDALADLAAQVGPGLRDRRHRPLGADARPRRTRRRRPGRPAGDPLERPADGGSSVAEIEERIGLDRLIELTGNRALTGFTAPKLLWLRRNEPEAFARIARIMLPEGLRPAAAHRRVGDRRRRRVGHAPARRRDGVAGRPRCSTPSTSIRPFLPPVLESPEVSGVTIACDTLAQGIPVAAGAGDCAAAAVGVGHRSSRARSRS